MLPQVCGPLSEGKDRRLIRGGKLLRGNWFTGFQVLWMCIRRVLFAANETLHESLWEVDAPPLSDPHLNSEENSLKIIPGLAL